MNWGYRTILATACALVAAASTSLAEEAGGILRIVSQDSPASMSVLEESTPTVAVPMRPVFNNLITYKQDVAQASLQTIVPDLATSWTWSEDGRELAFKLRRGVKWHDGIPFSATDVKCTWDMLLGRATAKFRANPRKAWYRNLEEVAISSDDEVVFRLQQPQPAFIGLLAAGWSPVYPCHVSPSQMRLHPIGTGPFKFIEYKPHETIKLAKNPDYWVSGRPYLGGIEWSIIANRSTALLSFIAGSADMTAPNLVSVPLMRDISRQSPSAICELVPANSSINVIINRDAPPFNNAEIRRAIALALDRKAFIDILAEGQGDIGGAMLPPPAGLWGMPAELLKTVVGYDPDVAKNRDQARKIMQEHGYGPDKPLTIKVSTRNLPIFRDPAVILSDQLKKTFVSSELEVIETANWFPKVARRDYALGLNLTAAGVDDPDQNFYENYACDSERNYPGYCNHELENLFDRQSREANQEERKKLVWQIDKQLQEDVARPIIYHWRGATCWYPRVKGLTLMVNSLTNGWHMDDVWLQR